LKFARESAAEKPKDQQTSPKARGQEPPRFVLEVKVDKTVPETRIELKDLPPTEALESRPLITLRHSEVAWRRGGLLGRYFKNPDFSGPITERIDPFVYFADDREQFTQVVPGATSAVWEGAIYVPQTAKMDLELALWNRGPGSGRALIDGEVILQLRPEEMASEGFKKRTVLLTEGFHELRLEYTEPSDRPWRFALFLWAKGAQGQDERRVFDARDLFYAENLGTTYCRWNQQPYQAYTKPFPALPGKNVLHFYTVDQAGNEEKARVREFNVRNIIDAELAPEGKRPRED
jgi:hypothetical protein